MNVMDFLKKKNSGLINSTKKVMNDLIRSNSNDWTTQKQIKELIETQQAIESELKKIQESIERAVDNYKKTREMLGSETLEKIQKLNKLMTEVLNDDVKKALGNFQNALQAKNPKQSSEFLKKAVFDKDEFSKRIDRTLSLLSQLKTQNTLKNMQKSLDELAKKQNQITDKLSNGDMNAAKAMQEKTDSELSKMQELFKSLKESSDDKDLKKLIDTVEKALETLKNNSEQLSKNIEDSGKKQNSSNQGNQKNAQDKNKNESLKKESSDLRKQLEKLSEKLNSMLSQMANREFDKYTADLEKIIFKMTGLQEKIILLKQYIEKSEATLRNPYSDSDSIDFEYLINLTNEYQNFIFIQSSRYFYLTTKSFVFSPELVNNFKNISDLFGVVKDQFTVKKIDILPANFKLLLRANAELTYKLIKIKNEMESQNSSQNSSGMSDRLEQLAAAQQSLNSMSFNFDGMTQEQLDQMSYEQSMIRQGLEQMMQDNRGGDALNQRLQKLIDDMNRIEKQLKKGEYNQQVKDEQKSFYNKMIESAKSLKKDEQDKEKRESRTAVETPLKKSKQPNVEKTDPIPDELKNFHKSAIPPEYRNELNSYYNMLIDLYKKK